MRRPLLRDPGEDRGFPDAVDRHLARCRRTEAAADVLVALCGSSVAARRFAGALRISDSPRIVGRDVHVLLDRHRLDRSGLEARLAAVVPGARFGWSRFPDDGLTIGDLVAAARRVAAPPDLPSTVAAPAPARRAAASRPSPGLLARRD